LTRVASIGAGATCCIEDRAAYYILWQKRVVTDTVNPSYCPG
jgi:hypothetical protein